MVAIAVVASLLGAFRLWQRAEFFRRQAALCAMFEEKSTWHTNTTANDADSTIEERKENERGNLLEARHFGALKAIYARVASHPGELLPLEYP